MEVWSCFIGNLRIKFSYIIWLDSEPYGKNLSIQEKGIQSTYFSAQRVQKQWCLAKLCKITFILSWTLNNTNFYLRTFPAKINNKIFLNNEKTAVGPKILDVKDTEWIDHQNKNYSGLDKLRAMCTQRDFCVNEITCT